LTEAGLSARVLMRQLIPFGPVMLERAAYLEAAGLIEEGQRDEEIVVVRADRAVNGLG
jgi:release factor glutamine methyltransferase